MHFLKKTLCCIVVVLFGTALAVAETRERIVSAGGSVTEVLFALGLGDEIVAVDTSSLYPAAATALPKIGYYRQLSPEGVLAQHPSVLVGHSQMGPADVLTQIAQTGVEVVNVQHGFQVDSLYQLINALAQRFDRQQQGQQLITQIRIQLGSLNVPQVKQTSMAFLLSVSERGLMAAGSNTMPAALFDLAGIENAFSRISGYQPVSLEALIAAAPQQLLVPSHAAAGQSAAQLCQLPALMLWVSQHGCRLTIVDPLIFMGLSPRLPEAVSQLAHMTLVTENE
jgi:iron complex transport system substrate-binding protein